MTQRRIKELLDREGPRIRKRFRAVMQRVKDQKTVSELETALAEGRIAEVLDDVEAAAGAFASRLDALKSMVGHETADYLSANLDKLVSYDAGNPKAVEVLQQNRARLVGGVTEQQRQAIVVILSEQTAKGVNPRRQAMLIRDVIGLTPKQAAKVLTYRRALETPTPLNPDEPVDPEAPPPKPRRGFTPEDIDRRVAKFADKQIAVRAETIARTETLSAVHEGMAQSFQQAIDKGVLEAGTIVQKWNAGDPPRTREWHASMDGQERPWGEPFISGHGVELRWPGDTNAPTDERARCRCAVSRRIVRKPDIAPVAKRSPMVIFIAGGPGTGKTTLGRAMSESLGLPLISTDDFIAMGWSEASEHVAELIADGAPRIVEGVRVPHILRKALAMRPGVKPCDRVIWLNTVHRAQTPKQESMEKAARTVFAEIMDELRVVGVEIRIERGDGCLMLAPFTAAA